MSRTLIVFIYILTTVFVNSQRSNEAIDSNFLESVIDAEECDRQIGALQGNLFNLLEFADAGIRMPKGILVGSTTDLGNYHQCLGIEHYIDDMKIEGKYCTISVPLNQNINLPGFQYIQDNWNDTLDSVYLEEVNIAKELNLRRALILAMNGDLLPLEEYNARNTDANPLATLSLSFGVCVPKPCTTEQAITSLLLNVTQAGFRYTENYCRLPGDKPWTAAEYTAVSIFSIIGFFTLLSTCYDLIHRFIFKSDSKTINSVYQSFSAYTNGQRLVTFSTGPGNIHCIDGIRTLATVWVILGHSFTVNLRLANTMEFILWGLSEKGLWISGATITVDTFFALGGVLLVYTTAKKMTGSKLLKNLHWFYLNRIVRITPLLAATVLLEASLFNHLSDGPTWDLVATRTEACRNNWWHTLLHIQNLLSIVEPRSMCLTHSWYLAIDMNLYFISPIIIYWVYTGKKSNAWIALISGLVAVLSASTIFNFIKDLPPSSFVFRPNSADYMPLYYTNPLTRASPFFVGLIAGYILHLYRDTKVKISWVTAAIFWLASIGIVSGVFYFTYSITQFDWDNQFVDNFMNSFMRPAWASCICWIIFACVHGYAGPINWFLSLDFWRLPGRLSYGMYLLHYPLMYSINGSAIAPIYFTVGHFLFNFLSYLMLSVIASYIFTIIVDMPFTALYRELINSVQRKQPAHLEKENKPKSDENLNNDVHLNEAQPAVREIDENFEENSNSIPEKRMQ